MFKGFMYKNGVFKCNLIIEFKDIKILKRGLVCASLKSLFVESKFCPQAKEEEYKCDSNITW